MNKTFPLIFLISILCLGCPDMDVEDCLRDLKSPNTVVKREAVRKIGKLKIQEAGPELISLLNDSSDEISIEVVQALGSIGYSAAVEPIIAKLNEKNPLIREKAIETLGKIRDKRAVPALASILEQKDSRSDRELLTAIWALGNIGDKSAEQILISLIDEDTKYVRYNVERALSRIPDGEPYLPQEGKMPRAEETTRPSEDKAKTGETNIVASSIKTVAYVVTDYIGRLYTWINTTKTKIMEASPATKENQVSQAEEPSTSPKGDEKALSSDEPRPQIRELSKPKVIKRGERIPTNNGSSSGRKSVRRPSTGAERKELTMTQPSQSKDEKRLGLLLQGETSSISQSLWVVEVRSSIRSDEAIELATKLKAQGFRAYVSSTNLKGQRWYRVRVGTYLTEEEAQKMKDRIAKEFDITDSWIHLLRTGKTRTVEALPAPRENQMSQTEESVRFSKNDGEAKPVGEVKSVILAVSKTSERCFKGNNGLPNGDKENARRSITESSERETYTSKTHAFAKTLLAIKGHTRLREEVASGMNRLWRNEKRPTCKSSVIARAWLADEMGCYTVHVDLKNYDQSAKEMTSELQRLGYQVYMRKIDVADRGMPYRLFIGGFQDKPAAERIARNLREEHKLLFIRVLPASYVLR